MYTYSSTIHLMHAGKITFFSLLIGLTKLCIHADFLIFSAMKLVKSHENI